MKAQCSICFHRCLLDEGQTGLCRARGNQKGVIVPLNYGKITSLALDPIEKKPLRRFFPGSLILSAGSFGCNMRCPFCQNSEISCAETDAPACSYSPQALVNEALNLQKHGNIGIAYTYNEPLVGYEFVRDCSILVRRASMANVIVTNGIIEEDPWRRLLPFIDAANIDLKTFSEQRYFSFGGNLNTVKNSIMLAARSCHLEVTTLIVPGENDTVEEMLALSEWLASVSPDIPLHVSRFFPRFHMTDRPPTPVETVYKLAETARRFLKFVYTGNC